MVTAEIMICPFCGDEAEGWEYEEGSYEVECCNCGKFYTMRKSITITYYTKPILTPSKESLK